MGFNTPGIIKLPFWEMTMKNPDATYACLNPGETDCPREIAGRSLCISEDAGKTLERLALMK